MSLQILVTGGAGYLGSIMVPDLLSLGHKVTVIDNFMYEQNSLAHVCANEHFDIIRGDIRDESLMKQKLSKADVVIPLAALVGAPICKKDPVGATTINHDAVLMMLKHVGRQQMILMPTTNSAYGSGDKNNFCTEESPLNPVSKYAKDKVEIEKALMEHPNAISFRLATVFGMSPRMRLDLLVNDFTYRAVNDRFVVLFESSFKRNYIHVRDVSRAFQHGIKNFETMKGQIYNVGLSEANVSKRELCETINKYVPDFVFLDAPVGKDPDQRNYIVSNEKIERTGYKPAHSLDSGIKELIKGYSMIRNTRYGNV
ncbi:NAD-dependent epimerase/dehydratase family protein [Permianibacter aggregans]|uniref:Nucleoside-diphosphate-sugar epimerase n=1 Tax=Permianibacter aggregans TaxID=1510150 RepID=A0A4R6UZP1_9GAMM|nr:SDR family oxidoreductase [Permianibacter aggregans]QGX41329.1 SDR family oxidoreductase [Permianibacter aggregans]TDQ51115.1 nucleoside-diphosphate-sugar epimerase [Permianibacter aggregans]